MEVDGGRTAHRRQVVHTFFLYGSEIMKFKYKMDNVLGAESVVSTVN